MEATALGGAHGLQAAASCSGAAVTAAAAARTDERQLQWRAIVQFDLAQLAQSVQ